MTKLALIFELDGKFMTTDKFFLAGILTLLFSCDSPSNHSRQNKIHKIVFATSATWPGSPIQAIEIDSSLTVKYQGLKYCDRIGFFKGIVSSNFWDTLNLKFESANFKKLDTLYLLSEDEPITEIYIYYEDLVKHITGDFITLPDSVLTTYNWLMNSIKHLELKPTKDSLKFVTTIQKPVSVLPFVENILKEKKKKTSR